MCYDIINGQGMSDFVRKENIPMKIMIAAVYCECELQAISEEYGYYECAQNKTSSIRPD